MAKKRVLSGIRATGRLHLGNYLGAVSGMLALQDNPEYETFYMVADLHTLTTPYDPKTLKDDVREVVLDYLAAGLDPEKSTIFVQSQVPEHIELSYLLSTVVSIARMQHLPTYKDKVTQYPQSNTLALLYYPVLMAADILVYKADSVPVGIDQEPHLEVAREIARKMNSEYGTAFPEPKRFATKGEYIPSLTGEGKMSKSVAGSYINLTDDLGTIEEKLAKVPTDSGKGNIIPFEGETLTYGKVARYENAHGKEAKGVAVLMHLVELFQGEKRKEKYHRQYEKEGVRYAELKGELAKAIHEQLRPIQERRKKFEQDPSLVEKILEEGARRARKAAGEALAETKKAMGLA